MCFDIRSKTKPKAKKAVADIVCYKEVGKYYQPLIYARFPPYIIGEIYRAQDNDGPIKHLDPRQIMINVNQWLVYYGIHSYKNRPPHSRFVKLLKCVIPKGTEYMYDNINKEYVSTCVKVIEEII